MQKQKLLKIDNLSVFTTFYETMMNKKDLDDDDIIVFDNFPTKLERDQALKPEDAVNCAKMFTDLVLKYRNHEAEPSHMWSRLTFNNEGLCIDTVYSIMEGRTPSKYALIVELAHLFYPIFVAIITDKITDKFTWEDAGRAIHARFPLLSQDTWDSVRGAGHDVLSDCQYTDEFKPMMYQWLSLELDVTKKECNNLSNIKTRICDDMTQDDIKDKPLVQIVRSILEDAYLDDEDDDEEEE